MDRFSEESPLTYAEDREPKAFFTISLPCESCGRPCEERIEAYWEPGWMVGACCMVPQDDVCAAFWLVLEKCTTVAEVASAMREHIATCAACAKIEFRRAA